MRGNRFLLLFCSMFAIFAAVVAADDIFVSKPAKKQSKDSLKQKIVHEAKRLMRQCNNSIRTLTSAHDHMINQIEDLAEGQNFFARADNDELACCVAKLEELCACIEKTRLEIEATMKQAFKSRKK